MTTVTGQVISELKFSLFLVIVKKNIVLNLLLRFVQFVESCSVVICVVVSCYKERERERKRYLSIISKRSFDYEKENLICVKSI